MSLKYYIHLDVENQSIFVEDSNGKFLMSRPLPVSRCPNPGRDALMKEPENLKIWQAIYMMIEQANNG